MVEPAITNERALKICRVLVKYKDFLRDKNYEMKEIYITQKLKHRLLTDYDSKACITNEINEGKCLSSSSINIFKVFKLVSDYKKMNHDK